MGLPADLPASPRLLGQVLSTLSHAVILADPQGTALMAFSTSCPWTPRRAIRTSLLAEPVAS